jgi:broad specificity phosphatase PhoE
MPTRVLLVRHGQSEWNAAGRWQGQADPPLSELGERQSKAAAGCLEDIGAIVTSDLARASRTAEIMGECLGISDVRRDPALRERDVGDWSGLTREEIEEFWPGFLREGLRPRGWEPDEVVLERALEAIGHVSHTHSGATVLAVTHGGVVHAIERRLGAEWQTMPNLGGRWLEVDAGDVTLGERVLLLDPSDETVTVPHQL